jgi:NADPH:quinone reductase-like Zn-dependent oxidoreductase
VMVGGPNDGAWLGALSMAIEAKLAAPFFSQRFVFILAEMHQSDLDVLGELLQAGKITPVIDRRYPMAETAAALRYLELGHARGKVIISVE